VEYAAGGSGDDDRRVTQMDDRTSPAELAVLAVAAAISIGALSFHPDVPSERQMVGIALAVVAALLLGATGRFGWFGRGGRLGRLAVVAVAVLDVVALATASSPVALRPLLAVALFWLVRRSDQRSVIWFGSLVAVVVAGLGATVTGEPFWIEWSTDTAVLLLPIAAADARRANVRRRADAVERQVAERLQAERLRIAHDLHDVVAHSLSAITVQSGIAAHVFDRDPEAARSALVEINDAGRRSLDELRSLLGLLRSDESVPLRPVPADPAGLHGVVAAAAGSSTTSTRIEVVEDGTYPADVAESSVVTVHRIVHECLVNVGRHAGDVPTTVELRHAEHGVHVAVSNAAPVTPIGATPSTGIGLIAIRERAELLGGTLRAGPTDGGGFAVHAFVPYRPATGSAA